MITTDEIAAALGVTADRLKKILQAGAARVGSDEIDAAINKARQDSEVILTPLRQAVNAANAALADRTGQHGLAIAQMSALRDAVAAGRSDGSGLEALVAQIV